MEQTKVTIQATIAAAIDRVWDCWTKPEHITKWNFAIDTWHCPTANNDLRVGGKYTARMEAKDGSFGFDFEGTYTEVVEHRRLVYLLADGREVVTDFEDLSGDTKVTTTFDAENENDVEMQRGGWQSILDNFKRYVESL